MKMKHDEPANDVNVAEKKPFFSNTNLMTPMLQNPARSRTLGVPSDLSLCLCLVLKLTDKHSTNQLPIANKLLRPLCMTQIHLTKVNMIVPKRRGPQYRPQNTIVLIRGTPKKVPLIFGNPHIFLWRSRALQHLRTAAKISTDDPGRHMGGCQNYGPFLGTLNIRCRIITRIQKGTIILTTTHIKVAGEKPRFSQKI